MINRSSKLIHVTIELLFHCFSRVRYEIRIKNRNPLNSYIPTFRNYIP
jgi:hypothetical protein